MTNWERNWCGRVLQEQGVLPTTPVAYALALLGKEACVAVERCKGEIQAALSDLAQTQQAVARTTIGTADRETAQRRESRVLRELRKRRKDLALYQGLVVELEGCRELPVEPVAINGRVCWRAPWRVLIQK